jgi:hypothetical protein
MKSDKKQAIRPEFLTVKEIISYSLTAFVAG